MKSSKKTQKRLDARINDFRKSVENMEKKGQDVSGFHCPGSRKKVH